MSKKLISLLLAVMLTVSMVAVAAVSVAAQTNEDNQYVPGPSVDTQRVYFMMPTDWNNDCSTGAGVYWWENTDSCPSWYGYNAYEGDSENVYYVDIPRDVITIIWNNGYDGGDDIEDPDYAKAIQTVNISVEGYDEGDTDLYPDGTDFDSLCDGMIYVINPDWVSINGFSGKQTYGGSWFYYYGDGKYGYYETEAEAASKGVLFTSDTNTTADRSGETDVTLPETTAPVADTTSVVENTTVEVATEEATSVEPTTNDIVIDGNAYLTVNATSNLFGTSVAQYNEETGEVVVTYYFTSDKNVENIQYVLNYDSDIFEKPNGYDEVNDTYTNYSSQLFGDDGVINLEKEGYVKFNTSNVNTGYKAVAGTELAKFTFKVKDISSFTPASATFDLQVVSMMIADYQSNKVIPETVEHVVYTSEVYADVMAKNNISASTKLSDSNYVPATTDATEATTVPETTTVSTNSVVVATSNITPTSQLECAMGDEIVVNYFMDTTKDVLATQWSLTYDPSILKLTYVDMPQMQEGAMYNTNVEGIVKADATSMNLYNVELNKPFVTATFEVIKDFTDVGSTYVDLNTSVLLTAEKNNNGSINEESEEYVVLNSNVLTEGITDSLSSVKIAEVPTTTVPVEETTATVATEPTVTEAPTTELPTEATEPSTEASTPVASEPVETTTEASTTATSESVETTVAPATDASSEATTTVTDATSVTGGTEKPTANSTSDTASNNNSSSNNGSTAVQTGEASMAVIILTVLVAATAVMFVLRKREML